MTHSESEFQVVINENNENKCYNNDYVNAHHDELSMADTSPTMLMMSSSNSSSPTISNSSSAASSASTLPQPLISTAGVEDEEATRGIMKTMKKAIVNNSEFTSVRVAVRLVKILVFCYKYNQKPLTLIPHFLGPIFSSLTISIFSRLVLSSGPVGR